MHSSFDLHHGDCLDILRTLPDNSIDAVVTDPPYGLAFMGKKWDYDVPSEDIWRECLRVLKPGGHLLAFAGTRTQHRMAVRIEDAGFEIRDMIAWVYGSGFPKSLDVSKAIDKAAGVERTEIVGSKLGRPGMAKDGSNQRSRFDAAFGEGEGIAMNHNVYAPATYAARQWQGWGTALKPALEPITVARKPLIGTVAENVLTWGTGGVNVDGCRVGTDKRTPYGENPNASEIHADSWLKKHGHRSGYGPRRQDQSGMNPNIGRWPANLIHDGSEEVVGLFPETTSGKMGPQHTRTTDGSPNGIYGKFDVEHPLRETYGDSGSAARFFYCAKASKADRGHGNNHPTVKPTDLMRYLCRLVTPPGGVVLDPFTGSGSTGKGAILEGFRFVGIEREAEYIDIARARIQHAVEQISTQPALDL